jgi:hypothetical protein
VPEASSLKDDEHLKKRNSDIRNPLTGKGPFIPGSQNSGNAIVYHL